jgi:hypothetical protein
MSSEAMKDMVRTKRRLCCLRTSTSGGPPSLSIHPTTNCCSASGSRRLHRGPRSSLSGPHDHPGGGGPCSSFLRSTEVQVHARAGSHPSSLFRALSLSPSLQSPSPSISSASPPPSPCSLLSLGSARRRCILL